MLLREVTHRRNAEHTEAKASINGLTFCIKNICAILIYALTRRRKNTLKNQVVADVLGQVLTMRLIEIVREEMGAAYSVNASCGISKISDGSCRTNIQIYAPVKPEMCDSALLVINQELQKIARDGAEDKYISKVKEYLLKTYTENERKNGTWLSYIEEQDRDQLDTYTNYQPTVQAVTSDDIAALAKQILEAKNCITVIMLPEE